MSVRLLYVLLISAALPAGARADVIRSAAEVLRLISQESGVGSPVELHATVIYVRPAESADLIVQDASGGIFIQVKGKLLPRDLRPGDKVVVRGSAIQGVFAPAVAARSIEVTGHGPLPEPIQAKSGALQSGMLNDQFIEVSGIVRSQGVDDTLVPPRLILRLSTSLGILRVWVLHFDGVPDYVGASVRVRGVCRGWANPRHQLTGLRMLVNDLDSINVDQASSVDLFAAPRVRFDQIFRYRPEGTAHSAVRVRGVVTWWRPGDFFVLQGEHHGIRIDSAARSGLAIGDEVEAAGFPAMTSFSAGLEDASFRVLGKGAEVKPLPVKAERICLGKWSSDPDRHLVVIRGTLTAVQREGWDINLVMEEGGVSFVASLQRRDDITWPEELGLGSQLELTGVCEIRPSERQRRYGGAPEGFAILLRNRSDVRILSPAPWLTRQRLLMLSGAAVGALILGLAWVVTLRRLVARRSAQVAREIRARHGIELEFETVLQERNRLAAELHDTLAQTLTGVSLQLQAAALARDCGQGDAPDHVGAAHLLLEQSREQLRRSVWDLRDNARMARELVPELQEIIGELNREGTALELVTRGRVRPLPETTVHHVVRLCQEALSNAINHAGATKITISVEFAEHGLMVCIEDNGKGFDPQSAPGPQLGHFGLHGMRERATRIGSTLEIKTTPGRGTEVLLNVPL